VTEWSKPEKNAGGNYETSSIEGSITATASLENGQLFHEMDQWTTADGPIPADAALRLLAAEASERLGYEWLIENTESSLGPKVIATAKPKKPSSHESITWHRWLGYEGTNETELGVDYQGATGDEVLAALHGKFLLDDAVKAKP
jgi:hypothetical protein